ncbi:MAG: hypothetical protein ABJD24_07855 [Acidimicrobiales bacterium]
MGAVVAAGGTVVRARVVGGAVAAVVGAAVDAAVEGAAVVDVVDATVVAVVVVPGATVVARAFVVVVIASVEPVAADGAFALHAAPTMAAAVNNSAALASGMCEG